MLALLGLSMDAAGMQALVRLFCRNGRVTACVSVNSLPPGTQAPAIGAPLRAGRMLCTRLFHLENELGTEGPFTTTRHLLSGGRMRILVIGATGLLGKEIMALLSEEHDVVGASRSSPAVSVNISDMQSILAM
ncbi:hypothetical protein [Cupriavidus sp. CuC1]|uniref:hypothetical protein n=1 Tax=Cupriavidus sp. CuC1 TaxID=3373131 RepID=UPI0037D4843C